MFNALGRYYIYDYDNSYDINVPESVYQVINNIEIDHEDYISVPTNSDIELLVQRALTKTTANFLHLYYPYLLQSGDTVYRDLYYSFNRKQDLKKDITLNFHDNTQIATYKDIYQLLSPINYFTTRVEARFDGLPDFNFSYNLSKTVLNKTYTLHFVDTNFYTPKIIAKNFNTEAHIDFVHASILRNISTFVTSLEIKFDECDPCAEPCAPGMIYDTLTKKCYCRTGQHWDANLQACVDNPVVPPPVIEYVYKFYVLVDMIGTSQQSYKDIVYATDATKLPSNMTVYDSVRVQKPSGVFIYT
jgi:hypothetical protein